MNVKKITKVFVKIVVLDFIEIFKKIVIVKMDILKMMNNNVNIVNSLVFNVKV